MQETRSYDADNNLTFSLRTKEDADDYRYFPEPDLTPFHITTDYLQKIRSGLPVLPNALKKYYTDKLHLSEYDASVLCDDKDQAEYFEQVIKHTANYKAVANWLLGPVKSHLNDTDTAYKDFTLPPEKMAALISLVDDGKLNFGIASSKVFTSLLKQPQKHPIEIATEMNLIQENDSSSIELWVDEIIAKMPDKVNEYRSGKKGLIGLFAGEVKKLSKGKADMQIVNTLLDKKLNN